MEGVVSFAGIGAAILASFAFSLVLEWASLVALMRLMPPRPADAEAEIAEKEAREEVRAEAKADAGREPRRAQITQETLRGMATHRDAQLRVPVRLRKVVMAQPVAPAPQHHADAA